MPYVRPQECGGRNDVRWGAFTDPSGRGVQITFSKPFLVTPQTNTSAEHDGTRTMYNPRYELVP